MAFPESCAYPFGVSLKLHTFGDFKGSSPFNFHSQVMSLKCEMCKHILESNTTLDATSVETIESQKHFLGGSFPPRHRHKSTIQTRTLGLSHFLLPYWNGGVN